MSATLKRRGSLVAVLLLVLGLAAALATTSFRGATAQEGSDFFIVTLDETATASNGNSILAFDFTPLGTNPEIVSAQCTGRSPRSGPNIPAQVVTQVTAVDAFALRILHNTGKPLNGRVTVNCVVGVLVDAAPPTAAETSVANKDTGARIKVHAVRS